MLCFHMVETHNTPAKLNGTLSCSNAPNFDAESARNKYEMSLSFFHFYCSIVQGQANCLMILLDLSSHSVDYFSSRASVSTGVGCRTEYNIT